MIFIGSKEERLVKQLRNENNGAMQEFYSLYADYLTGVCSRYIVNDEDIKDVLQDSLVSIFSNIRSFDYRGAGSLQAWAAKIVVNQSLKFLKEKKRNEFASLDWDIVDEAEQDDPPISDVPPEVIHRMVCELPTGYRTVFNLYVFENKSHKEIADLLGIKKDTSCSQFSRAKNLLIKKITDYYKLKQNSR